MKYWKIKHDYSYQFCVGEGTGDLLCTILNESPVSLTVPNTAQLRQTTEDLCFR